MFLMAETTHLYSVGEVTQLTGVSRRTLFKYDQIELLIPVERRGIQKFKMYDDNSIRRLNTIQSFRKAGLKLEEIKEILDDPGCNRAFLLYKVMERLEREKKGTEQKMQSLRELIRKYS